MTNWIAVIGGVITCIIGLWKYFKRKNEYKREQAEKARKDLTDAEKNDDVSSLLDGFQRVHK